MKFLLNLLLGFSILSGFGQVAASTDSISLKEAILTIERAKDVRFFYRSEWVDDQKILNASVQTSLPIEEILSSLLENTPLNYFLDGNQVILLYNTSIIIPQLTSIMEKDQNDVVNYLEEFILQNEPEEQNTENKIYTIGDIKKYKKGEESTINGVVTSENTPISDVFIFIQDPFISTVSDENGRYSIQIPTGLHELNFQSVTTIDTRRKVNLYSDGLLNVNLPVDVVALQEVIVSTQREKNINSTQMGLASIDPKQVAIVPALLGEKDIIKVATSIAGVQNVGEGSAGINIRGGKADQNLFLIDHNTVFTTNHFFGFFSAFNSRGVGGLSLYKNGIPAEYGGRLSSVFDIETKMPNDERFELSGGVGLVTSQLQVEGPVKKVKTNFLLNGRGTYSQFVLDKFKDSSIGNNDVSFYDLTFKSTTKFDNSNELSVLAYYSYDAFKIKSDTLLSFSDFSYENKIIGANWKHIFSDNLFGNLEVGNSYFGYRSSYDVLQSQAFDVDLFINELRMAAKFDYFVNEQLNYKFGIEAKKYSLSPGKKSPKGSESLIANEEISEESALDLAPYVSASYDLTDKLSIDGGLRYSMYRAFGPATINQYAPGLPKQSSTIIGSQTYQKGEAIHSNHGPEFRLQTRYLLGAESSIKASYNRTRQNIHLLLNAASIAPTDVWRLSGPFIKPQLSDQVSIGYFRNFFGKNLIETSVEAYYKNLTNLVDFKTGAELQFNPTIETDLLQGDGKSYGIEISIKKSNGWLNGWLNYTYSRSFIRLDGNSPSETINGGRFYPTGYDKPHYLNSVTNYKFTRRITMTLNVVYSSGIPVTYPVGKWNFKGAENILYSDRNEFRIPNYFRLDLGFNIDASHKLKKFNHSSWTFSVYNLLGRDNIYSVFFEVEDDEVKGYQLSIFPTPIPTITYNFRF